MSVKKLLATILALAMVLTMASFPAFAEGEATEIPDSSITVKSSLPAEGTYTPVSGIVDNYRNTDNNGWFKSARTFTGDGTTVYGSFVFEFENPVNLTEILFQMGGCNMAYGKLYASKTTSDYTTTEGWVSICDLGSNEQSLTYTTASSGAGVETTVAISHEDYYRYFRIDVMKVPAVNGSKLVWIETDFYGSENPNKTPVTYTVNYVDENENVLDTEVLEGYVDYLVTAELKEIDGYKAPETSQTIILKEDPAENVITLVYTKITADTPVEINPVGVNSPFETRDGYSIWGLIDGSMAANSNRYRIKPNPHPKTGVKTGDHTGEIEDNFNFTIDLGYEYKVTKVMPTWGGEYATGVALYGSKDGSTWKGIGDYPSGLTSKEQELSVTDEGYYRYVKVEAYNTIGTDTCCQEIEFEGVLSPDAILSTTVEVTTNMEDPNYTLTELLDGIAYKSGDPDYNYFTSEGKNDGGESFGSVVFEFTEPKNLTEIWFNMGSGYITGGKLYASNSISDPDAAGWTDLNVNFDNLEFTAVKSGVTSFGNEATATISHDGYYKYFKVEITSVATTDPAKVVWLETFFRGTTGTATPDAPVVPEIPEGLITSPGATIRLAKDGVKTGIRFHAIVDKALAEIDGDYDYDTADVTFGMFLLPQDMLGENDTLAAYLAAQDDGEGDALDIPAIRIWKQDAETLEYTAVLVGIPQEEWSRDVVAVPYMLVGEDYTYFDEMTKSYIGVAQAAIDEYEDPNSDSEITEDQYKELLEIVKIVE